MDTAADVTETVTYPARQLYRWESRALCRYQNGNLIAIATSPDEARAKLAAAFDEWMKEFREQDWIDAHNPDETSRDRETYGGLKAVFDADIAVDPDIVETIWIMGSE